MKALVVILLIALCTVTAFSQSYVERYKAPYTRTLYGAASFAADSHYVFNGTAKWVTVTAVFDSTAGTTAWFCVNNDSTNAIPLRPGVGGAYGDGRTFRVYGLTHYRVKGAFPITTTVE